MKFDISSISIETEYDEAYAVELFLDTSKYDKKKTEGMNSFEELAEYIVSQKRFKKLLFGNNDQAIIDNLWEMNFRTEKFAELVEHRDYLLEILISKDSEDSYCARVQYKETAGLVDQILFPVVFRVEDRIEQPRLLLTNRYPTPSVAPILNVLLGKELFKTMREEDCSLVFR